MNRAEGEGTDDRIEAVVVETEILGLSWQDFDLEAFRTRSRQRPLNQRRSWAPKPT